MRRPTPLPQPAVPASVSKVEVVAAKTVEVRETVDVEDSLAEVSVLGEAVTRSTAGNDLNALPDADQPAPKASGPVRAGDVLRAARARRRALRAEMRRFTVRQRRRRVVWLGAVGALVLLVALTVGAAYSPLFAVREITVTGTSSLKADDVAAALAGQMGTPLPLVDQSEVKAALVGFPLIETYTLEARPPSELVVSIVERTPIGVITAPSGFALVDAAGVTLETTGSPPAGIPVLSVAGGVESDAFVALGQALRSLPAGIRSQVTAASATTPYDIAFDLGGTNTRVVWGSADDSAMKAVVLETTMAARPPADVSVYDVSSPTAVVVG